MPVRFDIDRATVDAFRGIWKTELTFQQHTPTYLIGGNNTGKSTLLNALALAFRGGGFHTFKPSEFDFFRRAGAEPSKDFKISAHFAASIGGRLPAVQGVGSPIDVHGVQVFGRRTTKGPEHRHVLLNDEGKPIVLSPRTPLKPKEKEVYKDQNLGWSQAYARLDEIRDYVPEVWLLRADNLERSLYHWQTGPLQRLASILSERFLEDEWSFDFRNKSKQMPKAIQNVYTFFCTAVEQFPFWKDDLKPPLEASLSLYLGRSATIALAPTVQRSATGSRNSSPSHSRRKEERRSLHCSAWATAGKHWSG
jgi:hypothetical protein